ncbi:hypothetical protein QR680_000503 [Steinernema hermaphroditum]|uniref:Uncharacterized protein n=1 Tax=Steinernema hermaphroditum TaxID=289476 RepID=A0AA39LE65_9BILA|nr:hypothetical protein QR680_000503 [Steinernema hermaphroditum]
MRSLSEQNAIPVLTRHQARFTENLRSSTIGIIATYHEPPSSQSKICDDVFRWLVFLSSPFRFRPARSTLRLRAEAADESDPRVNINLNQEEDLSLSMNGNRY